MALSGDWNIARPLILKTYEDLQLRLESAMSSDNGDMRTHSTSRVTCRKRSNSSISCSDHDHDGSGRLDRKTNKAITRSNTRKNKQISSEDHAENASSSSTPQKPRKKKVRFSDPGPQLRPMDDSASTGLTPAILRTSFDEFDFDQAPSLNRTPSRRERRRSAPASGTKSFLDPAFPIEPAPAPHVLQFTPLRQILDLRTQRRIRRTGLSDEINGIEQEKRETVKLEKERLREKDAELAAVKQELEAAKEAKSENEKRGEIEEESSLASKTRIAELEAEVSRLREEISRSTTSSLTDNNSQADYEGDTIMIIDSITDDDTILISNSPDPRDYNVSQPGVPLSPALSRHRISITTDASAQAAIPDYHQEAEILALSRDLEAAKQEKRDLFNEWRSHIAPVGSKENNGDSRLSSPPPDFLRQIVPTLKAALSRASEASFALDTVRDDLSNMGFLGSNADEVISEMRHRFRSARMELERAVPGETPIVGLDDGNSTLNALVERVKSLIRNLEKEQERHDGTLGRERALRGQFDACLIRYEAASKKIHELEETIDSSAGDMLHARMRIQQLEREGKEQDIGIDRLNTALDKYHDEVKGLEELITAMEAENASSKGEYRQTISDLESKVVAEETGRRAAESVAAERGVHVHELQETVEQNRIRACDLTAKVESLEKERDQVVEAMERKSAEQLQLHDQEIGSMNVRISELTTSLEDTRTEIEKLRRLNSGLEERLEAEIEARNKLADKWAADQARAFTYMKESINAERRSSKVRVANWKITSDDLESEATMPGSEPITPVSMTRFVDVEVGRGKNRRRLDSGIGILTEEELDDDDDECQVWPNSDIDLPELRDSEKAKAVRP